MVVPHPGEKIVPRLREIVARPPAQVLDQPPVRKARARSRRERPHIALRFSARLAPAEARAALRQELAPLGQRPGSTGAEMVEPMARRPRIEEREQRACE